MDKSHDLKHLRIHPINLENQKIDDEESGEDDYDAEVSRVAEFLQTKTKRNASKALTPGKLASSNASQLSPANIRDIELLS